MLAIQDLKKKKTLRNQNIRNVTPSIGCHIASNMNFHEHLMESILPAVRHMIDCGSEGATQRYRP